MSEQLTRKRIHQTFSETFNKIVTYVFAQEVGGFVVYHKYLPGLAWRNMAERERCLVAVQWNLGMVSVISNRHQKPRTHEASDSQTTAPIRTTPAKAATICWNSPSAEIDKTSGPLSRRSIRKVISRLLFCCLFLDTRDVPCHIIACFERHTRVILAALILSRPIQAEVRNI